MKTLLPSHFQSFEGSLYDNRSTDPKPIRKNYAVHHREIGSTQDLKASLRAGAYAWPGGYEVLYVTSDGGLLCSKCVLDNLRSVLYSITNDLRDGFKVVGCCYEAVDAECAREAGVDTCNCDQCGREFGELA